MYEIKSEIFLLLRLIHNIKIFTYEVVLLLFTVLISANLKINIKGLTEKLLSAHIQRYFLNGFHLQMQNAFTGFSYCCLFALVIIKVLLRFNIICIVLK